MCSPTSPGNIKSYLELLIQLRTHQHPIHEFFALTMVSKCLLTLALAAVTMIAETSACPAAGAAFRDSVSPGDRARALATTPRAHVTAQNAGAIRMKLNSFLKKGALAYPQHRACQDLSLEELDSIAHKLACLSNRELHTSYQANDGRRVSTAHRPRVHETKLDSQVCVGQNSSHLQFATHSSDAGFPGIEEWNVPPSLSALGSSSDARRACGVCKETQHDISPSAPDLWC